jgi:hypothetical protein
MLLHMSENLRSSRKPKGLVVSATCGRLGGAVTVGNRSEAQIRGDLSLEAAVEVRLVLSVEEEYQESLHTVRVQQICFCIAVPAAKVAAVLPVAEVPYRWPVVQGRAHSQRMSVRWTGH